MWSRLQSWESHGHFKLCLQLWKNVGHHLRPSMKCVQWQSFISVFIIIIHLLCGPVKLQKMLSFSGLHTTVSLLCVCLCLCVCLWLCLCNMNCVYNVWCTRTHVCAGVCACVCSVYICMLVCMECVCVHLCLSVFLCESDVCGWMLCKCARVCVWCLSVCVCLCMLGCSYHVYVLVFVAVCMHVYV